MVDLRSYLGWRLEQAQKAAAGAVWRRRARRASGGGQGLVLYYHRIAALRLDPWRTSVSPQAFDRQLEMLAAEMRVLPLAELIEAYRQGRIPERAVAISFDDGYLDNLEQGLPLLRRHSLPATFYIATGLTGRPGLPWWDEIADLLMGAGPRPARLDLRFGSTRVKVPTATPLEREHALHGRVNSALKKLPPKEIDAALEPLRAWADRDPEQPTLSEDGISEPRMMTRPELELLAADPLAELGAHTALHPSLPTLDREAQRREVIGSRDAVAEITGTPPRSFAYPFGDNDRTSREIVREAGFDHATSTREYAPLSTAAREYEIPRMVAWEESPEQMERRMTAILGLAGAR